LVGEVSLLSECSDDEVEENNCECMCTNGEDMESTSNSNTQSEVVMDSCEEFQDDSETEVWKMMQQWSWIVIQNN